MIDHYAEEALSRIDKRLGEVGDYTLIEKGTSFSCSWSKYMAGGKFFVVAVLHDQSVLLCMKTIHDIIRVFKNARLEIFGSNGAIMTVRPMKSGMMAFYRLSGQDTTIAPGIVDKLIALIVENLVYQRLCDLLKE